MNLKITSKRAIEHIQSLKNQILEKESVQDFVIEINDKKLSVHFKKTRDDNYNLIADIFCLFMKNFNYERCLLINLREMNSYLRDDQFASLFDSDNHYWEDLLSNIKGKFIIAAISFNLNLKLTEHDKDDFVKRNEVVNAIFQFINEHFFRAKIFTLQLFEYEFVYYSVIKQSENVKMIGHLDNLLKRIYGENIKLVAVEV